jgi:predicted nucleic acid-binding protein
VRAFGDTSFFLALLRSDDAVHLQAVQASRVNEHLVTTEFVLLELGNACSRSADHSDFLSLVAGLRNSSRATIVPLSSDLFDRGLKLM